MTGGFPYCTVIGSRDEDLMHRADACFEIGRESRTRTHIQGPKSISIRCLLLLKGSESTTTNALKSSFEGHFALGKSGARFSNRICLEVKKNSSKLYANFGNH